MTQSMTGYGKKEIQLPGKKISIELKSLNSRSIDLRVRLPHVYRDLEMEFRNTITQALERGKVDLNIHLEHTGNQTSTTINKDVVNYYLTELADLKTDSSDLLSIAMRLPDAIVTKVEELEEEEVVLLRETLQETIEELIAFRIQEGEALEKDFRLRISNIKSLLEQIESIDGDRMIKLRERLLKAVAELKENVDENRFEQELIFYSERYDITEEKVRLSNHLAYFEETLDTEESNGKKLAFIVQEIGREINTIGSKANDSDMQKFVIQMKDELEKIKEQTLNVI